MNIHRLEVLRDALRTSTIVHTPGRFDLRTWAGNEHIPWEGNPDLSCGTTCCAVGLGTTIPEFAKAGLYLEKSDYDEAGIVYKMDGIKYESFDAVEKFFDISNREARMLFSPNAYDNYEQTSPNEVADRIQAFIENAEDLTDS